MVQLTPLPYAAPAIKDQSSSPLLPSAVEYEWALRGKPCCMTALELARAAALLAPAVELANTEVAAVANWFAAVVTVAG